MKANDPTHGDPDGRRRYWEENPNPVVPLVDLPPRKRETKPRKSIDDYFASPLATDPYASLPTDILAKGREIAKHNRRVRKASGDNG